MADFTPAEIVLQWSADPLSDTTPTWTTVNAAEIQSLEWWAGIDHEGNDPQPGGMTVRLKNVGRKWEPGYGSNLIDTEQRFRLTLDGVAEGVWYTTDFEMDYPASTEYSDVVVTCGDGVEVLALDDLPELDPPDAQSYADVVGFDQPWGYWRLGEPDGVRAVATVRSVWRGKGKRRRKVKVRSQRYETAAEAGGVSGPAGIYKNTPQLGEPGLILGDPDTSVRFTAAQTEWMQAAVEAEDFVDGNALTLEAWVKFDAIPAGGASIVSGPRNTAGSNRIFELSVQGSGQVTFDVLGASFAANAPSGTVTTGSAFHLCGTWGNGETRIYVNGVLEDFEPGVGTMASSDTNLFVYVGREEVTSGDPDYMDGWIDEVAIYERALSAERVLAHYQAGAERGFAEQTAGARIAAIATSDLWAETEIQTTGRDVIPQMMFGQARLEEIAEAAHAEGPRTMFFFNGDGNPVYLGHEWQTTDTDYNSVQAAFGDSGGDTRYLNVELVYDHETFNTVTASREGGPLVTQTDSTEEGIRRRRVHAEYTDLLLANDGDVESLAYHVLQLYKEPAKRPVTVTTNGHHALAHIMTLDIGHLVRVKKSGSTGDPVDRAAWIIGKRKALDANRNITCAYTLSRGFDGATETAMAGITGYSEADTAKAA